MIEKLSNYVIRDINPDFKLSGDHLRAVTGGGGHPVAPVQQFVSRYLAAIEKGTRKIGYALMVIVGVLVFAVGIAIGLLVLMVVSFLVQR